MRSVLYIQPQKFRRGAAGAGAYLHAVVTVIGAQKRAINILGGESVTSGGDSLSWRQGLPGARAGIYGGVYIHIQISGVAVVEVISQGVCDSNQGGENPVCGSGFGGSRSAGWPELGAGCFRIVYGKSKTVWLPGATKGVTTSVGQTAFVGNDGRHANRASCRVRPQEVRYQGHGQKGGEHRFRRDHAKEHQRVAPFFLEANTFWGNGHITGGFV